MWKIDSWVEDEIISVVQGFGTTRRESLLVERSSRLYGLTHRDAIKKGLGVNVRWRGEGREGLMI